MAKPPRALVDPDFTLMVLGHLRQLDRECRVDMSDYSALTCSSILRNLLIDNGGTLQRYRRAMGHRGAPRIVVTDLASRLPADLHNVRLAVPGRVALGDRWFGPISISVTSGPPPNIFAPRPGEPDIPTISVPLGTYLDSTGMVALGMRIPRRVMIKYVANKLGGVHYDKERDPHGPQRGAEVETWMYERLDAISKPGHPLLALPSGSAGATSIRAVHAEVIGMGQHLLASPEVAELLG